MLVFFFIIVAIWIQVVTSGKLTEQERVELWRKTHTWPPTWQPESDSYRALMEQREQEIMQLTGSDERWENWMQYVQLRMLPTFTSKGFDIIDIPPHIYAKLRAAVMAGIADWDNLPIEAGVDDSIYAFEQPKFVEMQRLNWEVIQELTPLHEQWAGGMKLVPTSAYGVRLYRNGSTIVMHLDKPRTHVISSILHLAHHYDSDDEPWPLHIEDHDGQLHAVALKEGQMLFYESAKCLHGRMRMLRGKYYGSLFVHYKPLNATLWPYGEDDEIVINAVPPHWSQGMAEDHGSRWAGQAITVDSRIVDNAPPRIVHGQVVQLSPYFQRLKEQEEEEMQRTGPEKAEQEL